MPSNSSPYSYARYVANGSDVDFTIDFDYLASSHLAVYLDGVSQSSGFSINTGTNKVTFTTAPSNGAVVLIERTTPKGKSGFQTDVADFSDGSVLTADDLDQATLGLLYVAQEAEDSGATNALSKDLTDNKWDAADTVIKSVATPGSKGDAVNKEYVDAQALYNNATALDLYTFTGDGTTVAYTLTPDPQSSEAKAFFVDVGGVAQRPTTDYTVSGTTLTFASAPANLQTITVRNIGLTRDIVASGSSIKATNGTTEISLADRYGQIVNVKDYGAKGDGTTDDATAIQAAITAAVDNHVFAVYIPNGDYMVKSTLSIPFQASQTSPSSASYPYTLRMFGDGPGGKPNDAQIANSVPSRDGASRLIFEAPSSNDYLITDNTSRVQLENLSLVNTKSTTDGASATALQLALSGPDADTVKNRRGVRLENVTIIDFFRGVVGDGGQSGLGITACDFFNTSEQAVRLSQGSDGVSITNCSFVGDSSETTSAAVQLGTATTTPYTQNVKISGCVFRNITILPSRSSLLKTC